MKYRMGVTVIASCWYTVEIEADSESSAKDEATKLWREETPSDFQIDKVYIDDFEVETEQLTWECEECGEPITEQQSNATGGRCAKCDEA